MQPLRVLTWPDYVPPGLGRLLGRAGIEVQWSLFDRNEEAFMRVAADPGGYDVIFADGAWPARYLEQGLARPLALGDLPRWHEIDPRLRERCLQSWREPAAAHSCARGGREYVGAVPAYWGVRGLVYDPAALGPVDSWDALWRAPVGTVWLNSQGSEVIAEVALSLGHPADDVYNLSGDQLGDVGERLEQLLTRAGGVWQLLVELERAFERGATIAEVHSTSLVYNLRQRTGRPLEVALPREGVICWIDGAMIATASKQPERAAAFIDVALSPEAVRLQWEESYGYWSANARAMELVAAQQRFRNKALAAGGIIDRATDAAMYRRPAHPQAYANIWKRALELVREVPDDVRGEAERLAAAGA